MIVHLLMDEKYTSEFVDLIETYFNQNKTHALLVLTRHEKLRYEVKKTGSIVLIRQDIRSLMRLARYLLKADRIIVHGLFNHYLVYIIFLLNVAPKVLWGIWGGDLYDYHKEKGLYKFVKTSIIRRFNGICTHIKGDADLARKVYGFRGRRYPCFMYPSCLVEKSFQTLPNEKHQGFTIMVGNSADDENRHLDILEKLKTIDLRNARIVLPLSYGRQDYADEVEKQYKEQFGDQVLSLRQFMPRQDYYRLLSEVDAAVYAHRRQQAVGNITQLVAVGAKVYIEPFVTTYSWLTDMGIKVFNYEEMDQTIFEPLSMEEKQENNRIICSVANWDTLMKQLNDLFAQCAKN